MRNAGRVVSKTMILSHVWDYSFDPRHQRRRRAGAPPAREGRPRLRPQADSHGARGWAMSSRWSDAPARTRSACAWRSGTPSIFVASSLALVGRHLRPARGVAPPLRPRDHRDRRSCSTPRAYASGGVAGPRARRSRTAGSPPRRGRSSCAPSGQRQDVVFLSMPEQWRRFDLSQLETPRLRRRADMGRARHRRRRRCPRGRVGPPARRHAAAGRQEHRAPRANCSQRFRRVLLSTSRSWS